MTQNAFTCTPDPWLGDLLERPAHICRVDRLPADGPQLRQAEEELKARLSPGPVFAQAKSDVRALEEAGFFGRCGFSLIETNVGLERGAGPGAAPVQNGQVRQAGPADAQAVMDLAARSFRFSRFHADRRIPAGLADRIKAAWAGNFFAGKRGELMLVAEAENQVAGFCQVLLPEGPSLVIDLICVDQAFRGRGLGRAMLDAACGLSGRERVRTGTQLANLAALEFYRALGFRIVSAQYVWHYHG